MPQRFTRSSVRRLDPEGVPPPPPLSSSLASSSCRWDSAQQSPFRRLQDAVPGHVVTGRALSQGSGERSQDFPDTQALPAVDRAAQVLAAIPASRMFGPHSGQWPWPCSRLRVWGRRSQLRAALVLTVCGKARLPAIRGPLSRACPCRLLPRWGLLTRRTWDLGE